MTRAPAFGVALFLGAGLVLAPGASAATVTPSPSPSPSVVMGSVADPGQAVTLPVEDVVGRTEDLVFPEASADGAVTDQGGRDFVLSSDVLFAFDQATLTARARREITRIADQLRTAPDPISTVRVTGFTDDAGSDSYNAGLSRRRAAAVRGRLTAALGAGVRVTAVGRGESDPVATNDTKRGRQLNRRVEIRAR